MANPIQGPVDRTIRRVEPATRGSRPISAIADSARRSAERILRVDGARTTSSATTSVTDWVRSAARKKRRRTLPTTTTSSPASSSAASTGVAEPHDRHGVGPFLGPPGGDVVDDQLVARLQRP